MRYVPEENADLTVAPRRHRRERHRRKRSRRRYQHFLQLSSALSETYGRTVELVDFQATGAGDDIVAAKADATQIVEELEPFAVLGGPGLDRGTFAQEITSNGIVCIDCAGAIPADMADGDAAATLDRGCRRPSSSCRRSTRGSPTSRRRPTAPRRSTPATPAMQERERKVGVIHFDQDPPLLAVPEEDWDRGRRRPGDLRARLRAAAAAARPS